MDKTGINKSRIITIISAVVLIIISIFVICSTPTEFSRKSNNKSSINNNSLDTRYLTISNVKVESNSSYTVCTGVITVSATSPYRYRFIEVKGAFKNAYGNVVDTDSTYAIGSEGLDPGESKTFRLSVPKDSSIKSCSVSILE